MPVRNADDVFEKGGLADRVAAVVRSSPDFGKAILALVTIIEALAIATNTPIERVIDLIRTLDADQKNPDPERRRSFVVGPVQ